MELVIHDLDGTVEVDEEEFGRKIHLLSKLRSAVPVPRGYCLSLRPSFQFSDTEFTPRSMDRLRDFHEQLCDQAPTRHCIVRSSVSVQNAPGLHFSGLFASRRHVSTFDELLTAIAECIASRSTDKISKYAVHFGIPICDIKLAILVQHQVEPALSGLAHLEYHPYTRSYPNSDYIEFVAGDMNRLIAGGASPIAFELLQDQRGRLSIELRSHSSLSCTSVLTPHLEELAQSFRKIKSILRQSVLVEFCIENAKGPWILQARPYQLAGSDPIRVSSGEASAPVAPTRKRTKVLKNEEIWGLKGAAMVAFADMDLFRMPLLRFAPATDLCIIREHLDSMAECSNGLTIRYSRGDEIGLPRAFAQDSEEAYRIIAEALEVTKECLIIVHPYLNVAHSYELIVGADYLVLEHIPGNWETNNILEPDVMILEDTKAILLKVKEPRLKIVVSPRSVQHKTEPPQDDEFFNVRFAKVVELSKTILRPKFASNLPLNFHFVETDDGEFAFLNIRRLTRRDKNSKYVRGGSFFHVRKRGDIPGWDRKTPILLRIPAAPTNENDLMELADSLPKGNAEIFITFGHLSHPAIILREFGVNTVPAYFSREIREMKEVQS